ASLGFRIASLQRIDQKAAQNTPRSWLDSHALVTDDNYNAAELADSDSDGFTNLQEYLLGTHPKKGDLLPLIKQGKDLKLSWETLPGRRYELQWTDDLTKPFQSLKVLPYTMGTHTDTLNKDKDPIFYRLKITPQ
ncbi:MAG: hypothetical protein ACPF9Q_06165, partial [Opitutales bacterium]